jgi:hypothetical protein
MPLHSHTGTESRPSSAFPRARPTPMRYWGPTGDAKSVVTPAVLRLPAGFGLPRRLPRDLAACSAFLGALGDHFPLVLGDGRETFE